MKINNFKVPSTNTSVSFDKYYELLECDIDFEFYLPYSLGCSNLLHNKITEEYSHSKEKFYSAYKSSPYYKDSRLTSLSVSNQIAVQYLIGILACMTEEEKKDYLIKLIKISFKFIYQNITKNSIVDLYELRDLSLHYAKKNKISIIYGSVHVFSIALYLTKYFNRKILLEGDHFTLKLIRDVYNQSNATFNFDLLEENKFTNEIIDFKKNYNDFPIKKFNELSLNHFITALNNCIKNNLLKTEKNISLDELNHYVYSTDFNKGLATIGTFLHYSEIDLIDLQNITSINNSDIDKILNFIFFILEDYEEDTKTTPEFLFGIILILESFIRDYQKVKNLLLNTSIEEHLNELSELKKNYKMKISNLEKIEVQLSNETLSLKTQSQTLEREVIKLQKENGNLLDKLKTSEAKNITLSKQIEDYKATNEKLLNSGNSFDFEKIVNFLSQKKLLLISGNTPWTSSLIKILPNLKHLNPSQLNKDLSYISNLDAVFFDHNFNNHSMFEKVRKIVKTKEIPFYFCGDHSNVKMTLLHFYLSYNNEL